MTQSCAQPKPEHTKFMDISMGESSVAFKKTLIQKGMSYIGDDNGMLVFKGNFTNQPVNMGVLVTPSNKMPACVFVDFSRQPDRFAAREMYYEYVDSLTNKYGRDVGTQTEFFSNLIQEPTDFGSDSRISDNTVYFRTWKLSTGEIVLHIVDHSFLQMIYVDSANMSVAKNDFNKDL